MVYFTAHTLKCVCHCRRAMFRVLGMYNFGWFLNLPILSGDADWRDAVMAVLILNKLVVLEISNSRFLKTPFD